MRRGPVVKWPRAVRKHKASLEACIRYDLVSMDVAVAFYEEHVEVAELAAIRREQERCAQLCEQLAVNLGGGAGPAGQGRLDGYKACADVIRMKKPVPWTHQGMKGILRCL